MTSLWRHLWPNYDILDFKILTQCVKMLGERVLQVWRWYLQRFRRYRKKTRGGGLEIAPPPVGRGIFAAMVLIGFNNEYFIQTCKDSPALSLLRYTYNFITGNGTEIWAYQPGAVPGRKAIWGSQGVIDKAVLRKFTAMGSLGSSCSF